MAMAFFRAPSRAVRIKGWRDFVAGSEMPERAVYVFGHGSFLTRLLMEALPIADIYVARVVENPAELPCNTKSIAKVR